MADAGEIHPPSEGLQLIINDSYDPDRTLNPRMRPDRLQLVVCNDDEPEPQRPAFRENFWWTINDDTEVTFPITRRMVEADHNSHSLGMWAIQYLAEALLALQAGDQPKATKYLGWALDESRKAHYMACDAYFEIIRNARRPTDPPRRRRKRRAKRT